MLQTCLLFHIANIKGTGGELIQRTKSSNPINSNRLVKVRGHYLKSTKHTVLYQEILTYCVSFRQCWDLSFLDAQTGSMNSMKMTMKVGNSPVITRKIQPFTLWREGAIYTPSLRPGFPKLPPSNSFTAHLQPVSG